MARKNSRRTVASQVLLDMTAMCDMAFLLLTFFMLSAKFKPDEPIAVSTPASFTERVTDADHLATITVAQDGKVYLGVASDSVKTRLALLVCDRLGVGPDERKVAQLSGYKIFGQSFRQLEQALKTNRHDAALPGIPIDSVNNELTAWLDLCRYADPKVKFAIKGDKETDYEVIEKVVGSLQDLNINKFLIITSTKM